LNALRDGHGDPDRKALTIGERPFDRRPVEAFRVFARLPENAVGLLREGK
jgi:hypothetical protein